MNNHKINNFRKAQVISGIIFMFSSMVFTLVMFKESSLDVFCGIVIGLMFYFLNTILWSLLCFLLIKAKKDKDGFLPTTMQRFGRGFFGLLVILLKLMVILGFFYLLSIVSNPARIAAIFSFIILLLFASILTTVFSNNKIN